MNNHHYNDPLDIPIKNAASHIFRRPYLFVDSTARMLQVATFLAIGPQIYVDGLVVINNNETKEAIGRIGSKHIIVNILKTDYPCWLEITAEDIMDNSVGTIYMDSPLSKALEAFSKTRFAFVPLTTTKNEEEEAVIVASLSIRDVLPLIAKTNNNRPIKDLCSPLIAVNNNTDIRTAIDFMMKEGIRNIGVKQSTDSNGNNNKIFRIINDRKILEFLLSHNGREIMRRNRIAGLADINVGDQLEMVSVTKVKSNIAVNKAAELLMDIGNPCLIVEEKEEEKKNYSIVTPWDIVMKTLKFCHKEVC